MQIPFFIKICRLETLLTQIHKTSGSKIMDQVVKISKHARQKEIKDFQLLREIILILHNSPQVKLLTSETIPLISAFADRIERAARNRFITVINAVKARNQKSTKQLVRLYY